MPEQQGLQKETDLDTYIVVSHMEAASAQNCQRLIMGGEAKNDTSS